METENESPNHITFYGTNTSLLETALGNNTDNLTKSDSTEYKQQLKSKKPFPAKVDLEGWQFTICHLTRI